MTTCKLCRESVEIVNLNGICRSCTEKNLVPMHCPECGHNWQHPGFAAYCPLCGYTNVTSGDKKIDEWIWQNEAEKNGVKFLGMQANGADFPNYPIFQDDRSGSFALETNETVAQAVARKRLEFKNAEHNAYRI